MDRNMAHPIGEEPRWMRGAGLVVQLVLVAVLIGAIAVLLLVERA